MKHPASLFASALVAAALAPAALADGLNPGSVLVYPIHRSILPNGAAFFTVVSVTNTNLNPVSGSTNVHYEYVNVVPDPAPGASQHKPIHCNVVDRIELLTPADTKSVLTNCHNASVGEEGYLVISAQDKNQFNVPWSFNYLIGSEVAVSASARFYAMNAIPFKAIGATGAATDLDNDGQLDFDDVEYEGIPNTLFVDSFVADVASSLILINMTGGFKHVANVAFDIWNDNEFPLSSTVAFRCWTEAVLPEYSFVFTQLFLANNTPDAAGELDIDCDGIGDLETGWVRIRGLNASSDTESIPDPALLGAIGGGVMNAGGRRLWESEDKQLNGDFFKTGTDDPEFP